MPSKTIEDFAYQVRDYMRGAEVVEGKNLAYSQDNNAVIATIENGKSYKVRWTGSATVTLKKNSASGTEVTSGSTSPLSFTADSDFDLYFGSSADVTEIMVYDGNETSDTYEPYYVPVKDSKFDIADQQVLGAWNLAKNTGVSSSSVYDVDFTKNVDDTITANGTNDGTKNSTYIINASLPIKAGTYYLSGGVSANVGIQVYKSISPYTNYGKSEGSEVTVTIPEDTNITILAYVTKNATISNVVLKPMISLEPNQPYAPYVMTNRELTDKKAGMEDIFIPRYANNNLVFNGNCNDLEPGIAYIGDQATNSPGGWYLIYTFSEDNHVGAITNYGLQVALAFGGSMKIRGCTNGSWSTWKTVSLT